MFQHLTLTCLVFSLALSTGCLFSKRSGKPKESSAISSEIEEGFRIRWIEKRAAELVTRGVAANSARTQASNEFRERFGYTRAAQNAQK